MSPEDREWWAARLDRLEAKMDRHGDDINALKVRDAYWAGGVAVLAVLLKFVLW